MALAVLRNDSLVNVVAVVDALWSSERYPNVLRRHLPTSKRTRSRSSRSTRWIFCCRRHSVYRMDGVHDSKPASGCIQCHDDVYSRTRYSAHAVYSHPIRSHSRLSLPLCIFSNVSTIDFHVDLAGIFCLGSTLLSRCCNAAPKFQDSISQTKPKHIKLI